MSTSGRSVDAARLASCLAVVLVGSSLLLVANNDRNCSSAEENSVVVEIVVVVVVVFASEMGVVVVVVFASVSSVVVVVVVGDDVKFSKLSSDSVSDAVETSRDGVVVDVVVEAMQQTTGQTVDRQCSGNIGTGGSRTGEVEVVLAGRLVALPVEETLDDLVLSSR